LTNRTIRFFQIIRVRVRFGDFICLEKIWSYLTQRAISCYLYKYRSRSIVIIINTINQITIFHIFVLVFYSFHFSSIRSLSRLYNLQSCRGSCLSTIQTPLGRRSSTSSKPSGALNCLVSAVLSRGFRSLFVSYGNTMESYISQNNILEIKETCSTAVL
jgi:hypothetical protein